jgi:predicted metalloprotease
MKYKGRRQSTNVDDRRGSSSGTSKKVGIGGFGALIIVLIVWLLGGNPSEVLNLMQSEQGYTNTTTTESTYQPSAHEEDLAEFVKVVFADTEDVWTKVLNEYGVEYRKPTLVLYNDATQSACGYSSAATGPFYCGGDERVYIDLNFLEKLQKQVGAEGDFAIAYIIAHEVGHHVQNLLGILDQVHNKSGEVSEKQYNALTVRLELQADFFAGVWAYHAQQMKDILEEGDIEEAMNAAASVGDDKLQMKSRGYVVPDSFTHGTSAQRSKWFKKGFSTGNIKDGDTFAAKTL